MRTCGAATSLKLTYNQQVGRGAVLASLVGANAGDVPGVGEVHGGDGQNALYVQLILSLGASPLLYRYLLRNR